ncbi:MAG: LLM class flavin-dependent oxidoreductase [SAR202 cluster bacterium]|nr:LLM class flavin-dependent oxidoreductase [SAR202 cluster bacterium]
MKIGYFVDPLHPAGTDYTTNIQNDLKQVAFLDKLGFAETWVAEHFTAAWECIPAPEIFIAQALGMTKNMVFGTGVTCLPNHNPFHIAHRIAQLDHQAKGRFMWGIGSGATPLDFKAFGVDHTKGENRMLTRENLKMVLKIWDGTLPPGTYENKFWKFTMPESMEELGFWVHMKPYQKPHPPIAAAGLSAKSDTLIMAGENGWIPLSINYVPNTTLKTQWEHYAEAARKNGHTPNRTNWRVVRDVFVADTMEEAEDVARNGVFARDFAYALKITKHQGLVNTLKADPSIPDEDIDVDYMLKNTWLIGTPESVSQKLRKLYKDLGGFGTLIVISHNWEPEKKWRRSMELLAKQVIPGLSDLK